MAQYRLAAASGDRAGVSRVLTWPGIGRFANTASVVGKDRFSHEAEDYSPPVVKVISDKARYIPRPKSPQSVSCPDWTADGRSVKRGDAFRALPGK